MAAYEEAKGVAPRRAKSGIGVGTWRWLCTKYFSECADYKRLDPRTRHVRRLILASTFEEAIAPGSPKVLPGHASFENDCGYHRSVAGSEAGVSGSRQFAREGDPSKSSNSAYGKSSRLSIPLAMYPTFGRAQPATTLGRSKRFGSSKNATRLVPRRVLRWRSSCLRASVARTSFRFGKQHAKGGKLAFTQHKGRNQKPKKLVLPILPALQSVIDASPCGELTFLMNDLNRPFTEAGFGNKFRDWCNQAGLRHCTAHGLRKAGATIAANNGATSRQLMAIFGWGLHPNGRAVYTPCRSTATCRRCDASDRSAVALRRVWLRLQQSKASTER